MNALLRGSKLGARCALLALVLGVLGASSPARAYHTEQQRNLEDTAYVLNHNEFKLGPFELAYGFYRLQLRTRVMPWILGAALRKVAPNLHLDAMVLDHKGFALSLGLGTYYMNTNKLTSDASPLIHVFVIPMTAAFSWRINDGHTVSLRGTFVRVTTSSEPTSDEEVEIESGRLADNFQLHASWEWRLSPVSALITSLRYLPYQGDPIVTANTMTDEYTSVQLQSEVDTEDMQHSVAGSISGMFSWKYFNLRVGVAYGALFLKGPSMVLPLKYPYPEFDLFWRF